MRPPYIKKLQGITESESRHTKRYRYANAILTYYGHQKSRHTRLEKDGWAFDYDHPTFVQKKKFIIRSLFTNLSLRELLP